MPDPLPGGEGEPSVDRGLDEERRLRSVAAQNAHSILLARQRAEEDLLNAKKALERKTDELATSLSLLQATLESTADGILVTDAQYRVQLCNRKYVEMWNIPQELLAAGDHRPLIGHVRAQLVDPAAFTARVADIYAETPGETFDVLTLLDGRAIERFTRTQIVDGAVVGRVWSFRDVTERKRAEDALREESRVLELLNRAGTALSSQLDLRTLIQSATDTATQLSGAKYGAFFYNSTNEQGDTYVLYTLSGAPREAFERFGQPRPTALFGPTFRGEPPIRSDDITADARHGRNAPHYGMPAGHLPVRSYLAVPVISRTGEVHGGLFFAHPECGVFNERTERVIVAIAAQAAIAIDNARLYEATQRASEERERLLERERLARANAERMGAIKDEFLATLSHELRTPLSAILGWSQLLRHRTMSEEDVRRALETIERNARAQTQLIEDLLDMSRITSGKVRLDIQQIDPLLFMEAALETIRPAADAKGIRLQKMLDPRAGPVSGDADRMQQVVWNLLSNAIKFTPRDGTVQVVLQRVNSQVEISVADTGVGIPKEFLDHVFDRFRQADASITRRYGGLGLGLSIVKHLVELHGGSVSVTSGGDGLGATFTVALPLAVIQRDAVDVARRHPRAPSRLSQEIQSFDLSSLKILVVDDEEDARDLIERILTDCAATVVTAGTAEQALDLMDRERPDVLISDIGMPEVDGFELLRRIRLREESRSTRTPAIALTAFARSEDRTAALRAGFLVHVSKPVDPSELAATVASVAGRTGVKSKDP